MVNKHRGWQRVLLIILPYIFIVGAFQFIGALISGVDITQNQIDQTSFQKLTLSFFNLLGTFLVLWLFMKYLDKEKLIKLGFEIKDRFKEFNVGIGIGLITMSVGYLLLLSLGEITFQRLIFDPKEIVISVLLFIIVAIVEEALLRGYVLRNLMISFNKYIALILSSILFSLMHGFNPNIDLFALTNLFLAGILLGLSYIHTKNLWFPIALHLSWNLFQTLFGFNVSGQDTYSLIEFNLTEKTLLNGGAFGFEGSILSIISMVITIILIEFYYRKKKTDHNNEPKRMLND
ncbi:CPBP family intramembrane glutamic endopeptidase [uncultured Lutibacter sp.]|uniref:CPBP family intramembrane glutamic endopeptidase n=1 Tax=uncultured Lutibacter sp. TaxID=437739 RepID=UPI002609B429|nr:type II CAAX endopeptidase family protein [uncultured Lutibacter sp.]